MPPQSKPGRDRTVVLAAAERLHLPDGGPVPSHEQTREVFSTEEKSMHK